MGKSSPPPPAPPDYAAANREAITTDIETLPLRNAINAASSLGRSYTDPDTGRTYDFTGLGSQDIASAQLMQQLRDAPASAQALLDLQRQYGSQFAEESRNQLRTTDPIGFALRDQLGSRISSGSRGIEELYSAGQPSANYEAYVRNNPDLLANWENNASKNTGMSLAEYGRQHYEASGRSEGRALPMSSGNPGANPPSYEQIAGNGPALQNVGAGPAFQSMGDARAAETIGLDSLPALAGLSNAASGERFNLANLPAAQLSGDAEMMQRFNAIPALAGVGGTRLADTGATAAGRSDLERQIFDELSRSGSPDMALQRSAEQAARARGAASGNILGDSSALQESLGVQLAQRQIDAQRRNDALSLLQSGQGVSDTNNRLQLAQQQSDIAGAGFNNAASQQQYANLRGNAEFNNQAAQQDFANQQARAGFNNAANNQAVNQLMAAMGFNNATGTQDLANQQSVAGFNNANAQAGLANRIAASGFNNQAAQQDFTNRGQTAQFNNATAQQAYANTMGATAQNNDTANQAFQNAMAAIGQRNQATQNTFGAQQGMIQQRAGARQQDLANIQSFLGLQPIVSQGSQLSGLQQGASPFMPGTGYQAQGVNQGAGQQGAEWAGQLYGAKSQMNAAQQSAAAASNAGGMGAIGALGGAAIIAI